MHSDVDFANLRAILIKKLSEARPELPQLRSDRAVRSVNDQLPLTKIGYPGVTTQGGRKCSIK